VTRPLDGWRVLVTRERPGELATMLTERGATVIHVPLIAVIDAADGGRALHNELARLAEFDWLIVTSPAGAERVGAAARLVSGVRLGAVGTGTARVLQHESGRAVDLVPAIQRADGLAAEFVAASDAPQRVLIAQADIAAPTLADALRLAGHHVTTVTAYQTVAQRPDPNAALGADAVVFASGSAVGSWVAAFGVVAPLLVVAIGPTTAAAADRLGLNVSAVAADHSLDGLVSELERVVAACGPVGRTSVAAVDDVTDPAKIDG
jgi:uroporphyrinogen-III synthase